MFWQIEDDLNYLLMEDDLNFFLTEDDYKFCNTGKTISRKAVLACFYIHCQPVLLLVGEAQECSALSAPGT